MSTSTVEKPVSFCNCRQLAADYVLSLITESQLRSVVAKCPKTLSLMCMGEGKLKLLHRDT